MSSPEEKFLKLLPQLNKSLSKGGKGWNILLQACHKAGLPFNSHNFPAIIFDGSPANGDLLISQNDDVYMYKPDVAQTLFGEQTRQISIHPETLFRLIEPTLNELPEDKQRVRILFFTCVMAIDVLVTQTTNSHWGENEKLRDSILSELIKTISPE